jgi:hypothetical protein
LNLALLLFLDVSHSLIRLNAQKITQRGRCAFVAIAPHPRITALKRKFARLANFPNFLLRKKLLLSAMFNEIEKKANL